MQPNHKNFRELFGSNYDIMNFFLCQGGDGQKCWGLSMGGGEGRGMETSKNECRHLRTAPY